MREKVQPFYLIALLAAKVAVSVKVKRWHCNDE